MDECEEPSATNAAPPTYRLEGREGAVRCDLHQEQALMASFGCDGGCITASREKP